MNFEGQIAILVLVALGVASIRDLQIREVPDWLSFALIALGFLSRGVMTTLTGEVSYLLDGAMGFAIAYAIAYLLFYLGQWGGGDAKMLMGMGALLGIQADIHHIFTAFMMNLLIVGSLFGLIWSMVLAAKKKDFLKKFMTQLRKYQLKRHIVLGLVLMILAISFFVGYQTKVFFIGIAGILFATFYLWVFIKTTEKANMIQKMKIKDLTEGEWIEKPLKMQNIRKWSPWEYLTYKHTFTVREMGMFEKGYVWLSAVLQKKKPARMLEQKAENKTKGDIKKEIQKILGKSKTTKEIESLLSAKSLSTLKKRAGKNATSLIAYLKKEGFTYKEIVLCGPKDLGIHLHQIEELKFFQKKKMLTSVDVKIGIPFIPSFFLAFALTMYSGNILLRFIGF